MYFDNTSQSLFHNSYHFERRTLMSQLQQKGVDLAKIGRYAAVFVGWFIVAWLAVFGFLSAVQAIGTKIAPNVWFSEYVQKAANAVMVEPYTGYAIAALAALVALSQLLGYEIRMPLSIVLSARSQKSDSRLPETKPMHNGGDKRGFTPPNPSHQRDENRGQKQPVAAAPPAAAQTAKKD